MKKAMTRAARIATVTRMGNRGERRTGRDDAGDVKGVLLVQGYVNRHPRCRT
ncbi:hypothetical protein FFA01_11410 [Frigoribacterium faeni]|uniref:Uncharacterized protein n=1 Tax=Frigoribacterium faeni TaxID=145483 RepID=A0ABQ0UMY2_9MICO|nr:hypothetical protein GCM10025699_59990 [Microbacterium flavescens]GEK82832.1 hypothetical protein FFA01_11410 [Frigoribacterium faeni]